MRVLAWTVPALALVIFLLLTPLPSSWHGTWQSKFFDLGHVPLFGALTVYLWLVLRSWPPAVGIALAVAALAELVQEHFGRTSSLMDFVNGVLGVAAAFVAVRACQGPRTFRRLALHALVIVALVAWPLADNGPYLLDAFEGARAFPTLADFATERQLLRWAPTQAVLERRPDAQRPSGASARLELLPGPDKDPEKYPGAALEAIVRDWGRYGRLRCSFTVVGEPLVVVLSVRGRDAAGGSTHYQFEKTYAPGEHTADVDLAAAAPQARPHPLNLADVRYFQVFVYRRDSPRTLVLHRVWLE